jgi:hypothetical protein
MLSALAKYVINRLIHGLFQIALVVKSRADNKGNMKKAIYMLLSSYEMLLPQRQITRRKLCFYYTCKFGVISIKYVIMNCILYFINHVSFGWMIPSETSVPLSEESAQ